MKWCLLCGLILASVWPARAEERPSVCVIAIREDITHNTLFLIQRGLREAAAQRAAALVLDMETNGGRVDTTEKIIKLLERTPLPSATYVNTKAYSAGAFISAATDKIYMAPGSVIGAATPVMLIPGQGVQELPKSYEEKIGSAMRALIRATAQHKGHASDVFEAMVDADIELTRDGTVISPKGKLLTLTNDEAARRYGDPPTPLLSAGTIGSLDDVITTFGYTNAVVTTVEPHGFEVLARWITTISPLLIMIGMAAIYFELKTPGLGIPTVIAVIAFSLYFLGFFIAGLAGQEELVLFAVGLALLLVEIFVLPGFGVAGVSGIGLILVSLLMAMVEKWPGAPMLTWPDLEIPVLRVAGGFVGSVVVMFILGRYLPQSTLFRKMELAAATSSTDGYTTAAHAPTPLLHATGIADTQLRPSGKGRFGDQIVDVVTEGDLIEKGTPIKVSAVQGSRVVVTRVTG
jgi:membrane-bound serine protease (ClpP class)